VEKCRGEDVFNCSLGLSARFFLVMLQTDMRFGFRNCVLPHALKLTKAARHAAEF